MEGLGTRGGVWEVGGGAGHREQPLARLLKQQYEGERGGLLSRVPGVVMSRLDSTVLARDWFLGR